jgi:TRAP-type C4-dicarboxylate transport system permease small subunit
LNDEHADRPYAVVDRLLYWIGAMAMLGLFALVFYGVIMRYAFNRPPLWSADVPNLVFIWLVFGIVGLTIKLGPHIRVVFFVQHMRRASQQVLLVLSHCAVLMMLSVLIVYSAPIIELSSSETMLSTGWPGSVYFYALPVGSIIIGFYTIQALWQILRGR